MAHVKSGGSTQLGRDSGPKYLGVKLFDGQKAQAGNVLIRQRGTKFLPGRNVRRGADDTLYAAIGGVVKFASRRVINFTGKTAFKKVINVLPPEK